MSRRPKLPSQNLKRTVLLGGRKTSVGLEDAFWQATKEIARLRNIPIYKLVAAINAEREHINLSSAIRLYVLNHYRRLAVARVER
jgi:predicted DNA-binding ribbon-helix-helix protein